MMIEPLFDYILIKPIKEESRGKFAVAQSAKPNMGQVVSVGPLKEVKVRIGQTVIFDSTVHHENVYVDDEEFILVSQDDVIAVVK